MDLLLKRLSPMLQNNSNSCQPIYYANLLDALTNGLKLKTVLKITLII